MLRLTRLSGVLLGVLAAALVSLLLFANVLLPRFEAAVMDQMIRWRGPIAQSGNIVLCAIDDASYNEWSWPWDRSVFAELIRTVHADGAKVIALDISFSKATDNDEVLASAIREAGNVVLSFMFSDDSTASEHAPRTLRASALNSVQDRWQHIPHRKAIFPNVDPLAKVARSQGFMGSPSPDDGIARRSWLVLSFDGRYYPSLPLSAVKHFLGSGAFELSAVSGSSQPRIAVGEQIVPVSPEGLLWINYRGGAGTFETHSALKVLRGEVPEGSFTDRLVFIGVTAQGVFSSDARSTPFPDLMSGVEIHANVADSILQGDFLRDSGSLEVVLSAVALLALGPLIGLSVASFRTKLVGASLALFLLVAWAGSCYLAFRAFDTHLQIVAPVLAGAATLVVTLMLQVSDIDKLVASASSQAGKLRSLAGGRAEATLALVLTEVVDSTVSTSEADPRDLRRAHFARARSLLDAHEGEEVDTFGDLFLAAFQTAGKALDFALDIHQDTGHPNVKLRGGIHMGQVSFFADEPYGNNLNFLARISMMPEGAEIWMSDQVKRDLDHNKIRRAWLEKNVRIRGFPGKQTLWALVPPDAERGPVPAVDEETRPGREAAHADAAFDVFLSYNRQDQPIVLELGKALEAGGVKVWLDRWQLPPGSDWQAEIEKIIETARCAAVLVGEDGLGPWEEAEMRACLIEFNQHDKPIIPVLLPGAPEEPELPTFLKKYTWLDLRDGLSRDGLDELVWGITGVNPHDRETS